MWSAFYHNRLEIHQIYLLLYGDKKKQENHPSDSIFRHNRQNNISNKKASQCQNTRQGNHVMPYITESCINLTSFHPQPSTILVNM